MTEAWHYTDLIKAHKLLLAAEGRYRFYEAYMKSRRPNAWLKSSKVPLVEGLLLFGWVHSWDPNFQGDLVRFLEIYQNIFPLVKRLNRKTIFDVNLNDSTKDSICEVFDNIAYCGRTRRFESTDTSKLLHGIIPDLFVMWDKRIREGLIGFRSSGRDYDGRCYAHEFLPDMQKLAKQFLDSYIQEKGKDYDNATKQISKRCNNYTLAKLIDELNYLRFTKRKTMQEIRSIPLR